MDPILAAIDEALLRSGLSDAAASKLAVGNYALIKNMRSARSDDKRYSYQALEQLARVLGLECYFGPKRLFQGFSEDAAGSSPLQPNALQSGFLPIPWHEDAKQKGTAPVAFQSSWLASEGLAPDFLRAIIPTNFHLSVAEAKNTVAILDTKAAQKGSKGHWCYRDGSVTSICRAAFTNDVIVLFSDDEDGPIRIVSRADPQSFRMLGRAVWLGFIPRDTQKEI